jgi:hypothetical protein
MFKEDTQGGGEQISDEQIKKMYRELCFTFHPDQGGDNDLMRETIEAYQKAKKGNPQDLIKIYKDWATSKGEIKSSLAEIKKELEDINKELFEDQKKDVFNRKIRTANPYLYLREKYLDLCSRYDIEPDEVWILDFVFDNGWLSEESYQEKKSKL